MNKFSKLKIQMKEIDPDHELEKPPKVKESEESLALI